MKVLLTGFEPFGQEELNPSWEAVIAVPDYIENAEVMKVCLPVSFKVATEMLEQAVMMFQPDVLLCIGQAGGRFEINIERVAINLADSSKPDNDGYCPMDTPVRNDAPNAYFSNLPVKQLVAAVRQAGIPAVVSNTAGAYVCNSVFYTAMHLVHSRYPNMKAGFIHIPYMPCQAVEKTKQPTMSKENVALAIETIINTLITENQIV